ncbi:MAG: Sir2 family NAD-dependent protein deacetylase [Desulfovibrio sp.]|jgi:NAD-dependent deacetylase|nr:Sir2 family NAD-dependent protein deacetylase [Desulfovibrio sp.]
MPSPTSPKDAPDRFAPLLEGLRNAKHCVALTGAGVSTLSGIPDFRGPAGLYSRKGISEDDLEIGRFRRDPQRFYSIAKELLLAPLRYKPSLVHEELARMESLGIVKAVLTQNIDGLHEEAGSRLVLNLHGSLRRDYLCLDCWTSCSSALVLQWLQEDRQVVCPSCGGRLKPDVVFFGEDLDHDTIDQAREHATKADLLLVLGTSLQVAPVDAIPRLTLDAGGKVFIVNAQPTFLDGRAAWRHTDLQSTFSATKAHLA